MDAKDFREALEISHDKVKMFDVEEINKYDLVDQDLYDAIRDFLSDDEILELFEYPHFINMHVYKREIIIGFIEDEEIQAKIFENDNITKDFDRYDIMKVLKGMKDSVKLQMLYKEDFIKNYKIGEWDLEDIIKSLSEETKEQILRDKKWIKEKWFLEGHLGNLIASIEREETKKDLMKEYDLQEYMQINIIKTCSQETIKENILKGDFNLNSVKELLRALNAENLKDFLNNNRNFLEERSIKPHEIIVYLNSDKQKEFLSFLEEANLTMDEKRKILATLDPDVKESINKINLSQEYIDAINLERNEKAYNRIIVNLNDDLEKYRGLDDLIAINPEKLTEEEKDRFIKLCNICPNLNIYSSFGIDFQSTVAEYKEAEAWIEIVIGKLKPEYTDLQKLAIIDNEIGKRISYSPDFETEEFDVQDCRALWKIIASGYGVCNGIASVEKYILDRIGIESENISSGGHSFLKIKNIEIPLKNGEVIKGNTILDPTWNLSNHRFGAKPANFCISYEEARKNDINSSGEDKKCHQNDKELGDANIGLEEEILRKIFSSVGLADKEGKFPIGDLINRSEEIHKKYKGQPEEDLKNQFVLLSEKCPEFATCQNSTMRVLRDIFLDSENLDYRCIVNRVFDKDDKEKRPVLYVYIDLEEAGEKFYYADKETGQMVNLSKKEFIERFQCYKYDLEKTNGKNPWDIEENKEEKVNLATSSGNLEKMEGEGR